jgi:hypothetical protein
VAPSSGFLKPMLLCFGCFRVPLKTEALATSAPFCGSALEATTEGGHLGRPGTGLLTKFAGHKNIPATVQSGATNP